MKEKKVSLKIFSFTHPLVHTEWQAIRGDKYTRTYSFEWEFVSELNDAHIIAWDGVITPKNQKLVEEILEALKSQKTLLLIGESMTIFKNHPIVKMFQPENINCIEVSGTTILPEDILAAFNQCYQKLNHV